MDCRECMLKYIIAKGVRVRVYVPGLCIGMCMCTCV